MGIKAKDFTNLITRTIHFDTGSLDRTSIIRYAIFNRIITLNSIKLSVESILYQNHS